MAKALPTVKALPTLASHSPTTALLARVIIHHLVGETQVEEAAPWKGIPASTTRTTRTMSPTMNHLPMSRTPYRGATLIHTAWPTTHCRLLHNHSHITPIPSPPPQPHPVNNPHPHPPPHPQPTRTSPRTVHHAPPPTTALTGPVQGQVQPAAQRRLPNGYRSSSPSTHLHGPPHTGPHKVPPPAGHPRGPRKGLHEPYSETEDDDWC